VRRAQCEDIREFFEGLEIPDSCIFFIDDSRNKPTGEVRSTPRQRMGYVPQELQDTHPPAACSQVFVQFKSPEDVAEALKQNRKCGSQHAFAPG
jgi:hypothetical protein